MAMVVDDASPFVHDCIAQRLLHSGGVLDNGLALPVRVSQLSSTPPV
jgi:hypothetical protein